MRFIWMPVFFVLGALLVIGLIHGDLLFAFTHFSVVRDEAKLACLFAAFIGFFAALLRG